MASKRRGREGDDVEGAIIHPDGMESGGGGGASDFSGVIAKVRVGPWDYEGKRDWQLAVYITYLPDQDSGYHEFTDKLSVVSAKQIRQWCPWVNGEVIELPENLDDLDDLDNLEEYMGTRLVFNPELPKKRKAPRLNDSTKFAQWVSFALEADMPIEKTLQDYTYFEGMRGYFEVVDQTIKIEGSNLTILVMTEFESMGDKQEVTKRSQGSKESPRRRRKRAKKEPDEGETRKKLEDLLFKVLDESDEGDTTMALFRKEVVNAFTGSEMVVAAKISKTGKFYSDLGEDVEVAGNKIFDNRPE